MLLLHRQVHETPLFLYLYRVIYVIYVELKGDQIHILLPI